LIATPQPTRVMPVLLIKKPLPDEITVQEDSCLLGRAAEPLECDV
jgi:hypothetical protein